MDSRNLDRMYSLCYKSQKILDDFMVNAELSKPEYIMLQVLQMHMVENKRITTTNLSRLLSVSKAAISQVCKNLEDKGLITRIPNEEDRRSAYIVITAVGAECLKISKTKIDKKVSAVFDLLGEKDTEKMLAILEKALKICEGN